MIAEETRGKYPIMQGKLPVAEPLGDEVAPMLTSNVIILLMNSARICLVTDH
jgi:hypothetical protein